MKQWRQEIMKRRMEINEIIPKNDFLRDDCLYIGGRIDLLAKATGGDGSHINGKAYNTTMSSSPRQIRQDLERIYIALKACGQYEGIVREGFDNLAAVFDKGIEELKASLQEQTSHNIATLTSVEIAHDELEYDSSNDTKIDVDMEEIGR
jgi:hypothetical protein